MSDVLLSWVAKEAGLRVDPSSVAQVRVRPYPLIKTARAARRGARQGSNASETLFSSSLCRVWGPPPRARPPFAQDFANGFLWGQLLGALHMQPDADKFENRNTPDAMIGNYTRLQVRAAPCVPPGAVMQPAPRRPRPERDCVPDGATVAQPTFKRLGVAMNSRVANSLMREEAGVALRLLYSIKQSLGQKDPEVRGRTLCGPSGQGARGMALAGVRIPLTRC